MLFLFFYLLSSSILTSGAGYRTRHYNQIKLPVFHFIPLCLCPLPFIHPSLHLRVLNNSAARDAPYTMAIAGSPHKIHQWVQRNALTSNTEDSSTLHIQRLILRLVKKKFLSLFLCLFVVIFHMRCKCLLSIFVCVELKCLFSFDIFLPSLVFLGAKAQASSVQPLA